MLNRLRCLLGWENGKDGRSVGAGVVGLSEPLFLAIHDVKISVAFLALEL